MRLTLTVFSTGTDLVQLKVARIQAFLSTFIASFK